MYSAAGKVLEAVEQKRGSVKNLAFSSPGGNGRKIYALVAETLKRYNVIEQTVAASNILEHNGSEGCGVNRHQVYVAVYDLLCGCKKVKGREKVAVVVRKNARVLRRCFSELQLGEDQQRSLEGRTTLAMNCALLVRYARVNTLKASLEEVIKSLSGAGFTEVKPDSFWEVVETHKRNKSLDAPSHYHHWFTHDCIVPNLLLFSVHAKLQESSLYKQGELILQDRASCLPAQVLSPSHDSHVIDACAAPGNKTTHLAALMDNCGSIEAFDIDPARCDTLQRMVNKAGASCVTVHTKDFLKVDPQCYPNVTHILVDPSCSGSGIVRREEHPLHLTRGPDQQRLRMLAAFQLRVLLHALSFPSIERVVYSTCSVHQEENEDVVKKALEVIGRRFQLVSAMPEWPTRGRLVIPNGHNCLRADPAQDHTNGFFVALFERKQSSKERHTETGGKRASLTRPSHGDTDSVQTGLPPRSCGYKSLSVLQPFGGGKGRRHFKRHRIQLALSRRLSHRGAVHCNKRLFYPYYVFYPKYRCYYNVCTYRI